MTSNATSLNASPKIEPEIRIIRKWPALWFALFCLPFLVILVLAVIFYAENVQKLPVAMVDQDLSSTSMSITKKINALPEIDLLQNARFSDLAQAKQALLANQVYAVIFIPPRFEQHVLAGQSPEITTFYNNQFMTIGSTLNRSIYTALATILAEQKTQTLMNNGLPLRIAKNQVQAISLQLHPVFNPTLSFISTLTSGAFPAIMQILIMMIITTTLQYEWHQRNDFKTLAAAAHFSILSLLRLKMPIYLGTFLLVFLIFDALLSLYFHVSFSGQYALLFIGTVLFIVASIAIATLFALLIPDKLRNYGLVSLFCSPAFGFTGLIFPHLAMNSFAESWACFLPVNWMIKIRMDQSLRHVDWSAMLLSFGVLILMIVISLLLCQLKLNKMKSSQFEVNHA